MSRIAAAGVLRLALRWRALASIVIVSGLVARVISGRRRQPDYRPPAARAS